jgi:5-methylcytosine-specific restriction endonuclease McrA
MAKMPLSDFPPEKRAEIERLASGLRPPPKWLNFGHVQIVSRAYYEWHIRRQRERKRVKRHRIADRDGWLCGICGDPIQPADLHIDHIKPVSKGGTSDPENLQATHSWCNISKGARWHA